MTTDQNWPKLSAARIDAMAARAMQEPQEKPAPRYSPMLALAASVVLLAVVGVTWQLNMPRAVNEDTAELTDYIFYDVMDDMDVSS